MATERQIATWILKRVNEAFEIAKTYNDAHPETPSFFFVERDLHRAMFSLDDLIDQIDYQKKEGK